MRALVPLLLLTAAFGAPGKPAEDPLDKAIEGRTAGKPQSCVASRGSSALRAIDRRTIVYDDGPTVWVSKTESDCFRPHETLIVSMHGSQYCRGDRVSSLAIGSVISGPTCLLGTFTPYRRPPR